MPADAQPFGGIRQSLAAVAGPAAWSAQLVIGYGLSSYACAPHHLWRPAPLAGWDWLRPGLATLNVAAAVACLVGAWLCWRTWRRARGPNASLASLDIARGRRRYFGVWGLLMNLGFLLAVLFDSVILAGAPLCAD